MAREVNVHLILIFRLNAAVASRICATLSLPFEQNLNNVPDETKRQHSELNYERDKITQTAGVTAGGVGDLEDILDDRGKNSIGSNLQTRTVDISSRNKVDRSEQITTSAKYNYRRKNLLENNDITFLHKHGKVSAHFDRSTSIEETFKVSSLNKIWESSNMAGIHTDAYTGNNTGSWKNSDPSSPRQNSHEFQSHAYSSRNLEYRANNRMEMQNIYHRKNVDVQKKQEESANSQSVNVDKNEPAQEKPFFANSAWSFHLVNVILHSCVTYCYVVILRKANVNR